MSSLAKETDMVRTWNVAALLILGLATEGCGYSSKYMLKLEAPQPIQPDPSSATVVVIRPSGYASGIRPAILDSQAGFLG